MTRALDFNGRWQGPRDIGTRTLGTAWRDIGTAVKVGGATMLTSFLRVQIHAGTACRFRLLGLYDSAGSAFGIGSYEAGTGTITVNDLIYQLGTDADQNIALNWPLWGTTPFVKLQGQIGAGSATYVSDAQFVTSF